MYSFNSLGLKFGKRTYNLGKFKYLLVPVFFGKKYFAENLKIKIKP
jgi:hypothetical protein